MKIIATGALILALVPMASAEAQLRGPASYPEALDVFNRDKDRPEFRQYLGEFVRWSNRFKLDTRNGCHTKGTGPVKLLLVITSRGVIEPVMSNVDGPKALCLRMSYSGQKVKPPPYEPLVIQLSME